MHILIGFILLTNFKFYTVTGICTDINPPQNAYITGDCVNPREGGLVGVGSRCDIHCLSSCRFEDSPISVRSVQCLANGWDRNPASLRCITSQSCDSIPLIAGRTYSCSKSFNFESVCNFDCMSGFSRGLGLSSITCLPNNMNACSLPTWSAPLNQILTCNQNRCPDLSLNGQTCIGAIQGQQCTLQCNAGTFLNLNNAQQITLTCGGTQWQPFISQIPRCIETTCLNLVPPANGGFTSGSSCAPGVAGRRCSFQCNAGFVLNADISLLCQSNGTWSLGGQVPACIPPAPPITCPALPSVIPNGGIRNLTGCAPPVPGARCVYDCDANFRLVGDGEKFCQRSNGQWYPSNTQPNCTLILCPAKPLIPNSRQIGQCNPGVSGSICSYECAPTYGIIGTRDFRCQPPGVWNPSGIPEPLPYCARIYCPSLRVTNNFKNVANYSGSCETSIPGGICTITCTSGYVYPILCQITGTWTDTIRCNATNCPYLPYPENGFNYGVCSGSVQVGQVCNFGCNDTTSVLLPREAAKVTCTANGWDKYDWNDEPQCERYIPCPSIGAPMNGNITGTCIPGKPFESCDFSCNAGYELSGSKVKSMACHMNGSWTPNIPPTCKSRDTEQQCPGVEVKFPVKMSGNCAPGLGGKDCEFDCEPGFRLIGQKIITCNGGVWSAEPPECSKLPRSQCPKLSLPRGAIAGRNCAQRRVNTRCDITCGSGYHGRTTMFCRANGNWNGKMTQCLRQCTALRNTNARLSGQCYPTGLEGRSCTVICNPGFRRVGPRSVSCQENGYWSPSLPQCLRNTRRIILG